MPTAKNAVFIGLQLEKCCLVGVIFLGGGRMSKFWAGRSTLQYKNPSDVLFLGLHDLSLSL